MKSKSFIPYLINFIVFTSIFSCIAIIFNFIPFGHKTMLTIDLGQQYIDFYSAYRQAILKDPSLFIYSFQKSIGGEMIGLWAYYLMSPFNLIFLLFKQEQLDLAVTIITYLKLLAMSLSFMYCCRYQFKASTLVSLSFSLSYAFMSYTMVYALNIMWLDGLILLPIIVVGLDKLLKGTSYLHYLIALTAMLMINYYIGYMICIFLSLFTIYLISATECFSFKNRVIQYLKFVGTSLLATSLAGITLVPAFYYLLTSKGANSNFEWSFETTMDGMTLISKLFSSSFIFDEIKEGAPPLYAGALILILFVFYFINKEIKLSQKITAFIILLFFAISLYFKVPNQLFHGGQDPIWYPYRYSFLITFFMIYLALETVQLIKFKQPTILQTLIIIVLFSSFCFYYLMHQVDYFYLTTHNILLTMIFAFILILLFETNSMTWHYKEIVLVMVVVIDLFINGVQIIQQMSYVDQSKYQDYTQLLVETTTPLKPSQNEFYRIHKNFARTKDEAFFAHYYGLDNFSSTIEAATNSLFGYLGLPETSGNATYANGTLFTDDFFNIKYLLEANIEANEQLTDEQYSLSARTSDFDVQQYPLVKHYQRVNVYENEQRFGLGIEVSNEILNDSSTFKKHDPIANQEVLLRLIDFEGSGQPYFTKKALAQTNLINVSITNKTEGNYFTYHSLINDVLGKEKGTIQYQFKTESDNPYYFTLPSQYDHENVKLTLDKLDYHFSSPFRQRQVTNAAFKQKNQNHLFEVTLLEEELKANQIALYEFDNERYQQMVQSKQTNLFNIEHFSNTAIRGKIDFKQTTGQLLFTIPYDENWQVKVDGNIVQTHSVLNNTLLSIDLTKGEHQIELNYLPKSIKYGTILSIIGLGIVCIIQLSVYFYKKNGDLNEEKHL